MGEIKWTLLGRNSHKWMGSKIEYFDSREDLIFCYAPTKAQWEEFSEMIAEVEMIENGDFVEVAHG